MPLTSDTVFSNYWARKKQLQNSRQHFPVRRWTATEDLCEIEQIYFDSLKNCKSLLDVGAGDLRIKNKLQRAGYTGEYHTLDPSQEHNHTYSHFSEIKRKYQVILCLDVIEHMPFKDGLELIQQMTNALEAEGVLILQTPNARCIRSPMASDMTHLHAYNLPDLCAYLETSGFECRGYRVSLGRPPGLVGFFVSILSKFVITRLLGADHADNIAVVAKRTSSKG